MMHSQKQNTFQNTHIEQILTRLDVPRFLRRPSRRVALERHRRERGGGAPSGGPTKGNSL